MMNMQLFSTFYCLLKLVPGEQRQLWVVYQFHVLPAAKHDESTFSVCRIMSLKYGFATVWLRGPTIICVYGYLSGLLSSTADPRADRHRHIVSCRWTIKSQKSFGSPPEKPIFDRDQAHKSLLSIGHHRCGVPGASMSCAPCRWFGENVATKYTHAHTVPHYSTAHVPFLR